MTDHRSPISSVGFSRRRRVFLFGAAGGLLLLGTAGAVSLNGVNESRIQWLKSTIRQHLPGVTIDEMSLEKFASDIVDAGMVDSTARKISIGLAQAAPWVTSRLPLMSEGLQKLERQVLTEFLLGSDFFRMADPRAQTVTYYARAVACANPFSRAA